MRAAAARASSARVRPSARVSGRSAPTWPQCARAPRACASTAASARFGRVRACRRVRECRGARSGCAGARARGLRSASITAKCESTAGMRAWPRCARVRPKRACAAECARIGRSARGTPECACVSRRVSGRVRACPAECARVFREVRASTASARVYGRVRAFRRGRMECARVRPSARESAECARAFAECACSAECARVRPECARVPPRARVSGSARVFGRGRGCKPARERTGRGARVPPSARESARVQPTSSRPSSRSAASGWHSVPVADGAPRGASSLAAWAPPSRASKGSLLLRPRARPPRRPGPAAAHHPDT